MKLKLFRYKNNSENKTFYSNTYLNFSSEKIIIK